MLRCGAQRHRSSLVPPLGIKTAFMIRISIPLCAQASKSLLWFRAIFVCVSQQKRFTPAFSCERCQCKKLLLCFFFFVHEEHRGSGANRLLLQGFMAVTRKEACILEGRMTLVGQKKMFFFSCFAAAWVVVVQVLVEGDAGRTRMSTTHRTPAQRQTAARRTAAHRTAARQTTTRRTSAQALSTLPALNSRNRFQQVRMYVPTDPRPPGRHGSRFIYFFWPVGRCAFFVGWSVGWLMSWLVGRWVGWWS